ncbi:LysM domain-containing protein [Nocardioides nanhaiensis]|uniref:LysM domain-containing protein n=1 Tax=Nocardioides nanhaiensis TaxID=1476871 RepID=A0ABP8VZX4_9ACTN
MHHSPPTRTRCLAVWLAALAAVVAVVAWVLPDLRDAGHHLLGTGPADAQPFARWLAWVAAAALAGCAGWAGYVTSVVVLEALRGAPTASGAGVPAWSRRLVLAACGAAVVAGIPAGAHAADPAPGPAATGGQDRLPGLHGLPLPERAQAGSVTDLVGGLLLTSGSPGPVTAPPDREPPPHVADPGREPGGRHHVVAPGESLWTIARSAVPAPAHAAAVAAYWPRLHAANRAVLGADPDLITPGQRLLLPPVESTTDHPREDHR